MKVTRDPVVIAGLWFCEEPGWMCEVEILLQCMSIRTKFIEEVCPCTSRHLRISMIAKKSRAGQREKAVEYSFTNLPAPLAVVEAGG